MRKRIELAVCSVKPGRDSVRENTEEKLIRVLCVHSVHMWRERERGNEVGFQQMII
jgi:hypothetical protein